MKTGDLVELSSFARLTNFWECLFGEEIHSMLGLVLSYDCSRNSCEVLWSNGRHHKCVGAEDLTRVY